MDLIVVGSAISVSDKSRVTMLCTVKNRGIVDEGLLKAMSAVSASTIFCRALSVL